MVANILPVRVTRTPQNMYIGDLKLYYSTYTFLCMFIPLLCTGTINFYYLTLDLIFVIIFIYIELYEMQYICRTLYNII